MNLFQLMWRERVKEALKAVYLSCRGAFFNFPLLFRSPLHIEKGGVKRILVLRHDRIGDMVATLPALRALQRLFPSAEVTVLASASNAAVLQGFPAVRHVKIFEGREEYRRWVRNEHFNLAVDMIPTYDLEPARMTAESGAQWTIGYNWGGTGSFFTLPSPDYKADEAFSLSMLRLVQWLIPSGEGEIERDEEDNILLTLRSEEKVWAENFCGRSTDKTEPPLVALHPGGNYPSQRWDIENFIDVAESLLQRSYSVLFFLSPETGKEKCEEVRNRLARYQGVLFAEEVSLRQLMALLSCSSLLLCNNTGVLHLAAALGVRTVSTMGPTKHKVWMPMGQGHIVFRTNAPCSPCNRAECPDHRCLKEIKSAAVLVAIRQLLEHDEKRGERR